MTTRCRYCFRVVADEAAHVRAEHELHLTRNRARVEPQTFQPRSMCPTCFRLTSNVHVHHENVHVTSVSIYIRPDREVFHRAANGMFNCPCCAARFLNPVRFRHHYFECPVRLGRQREQYRQRMANGGK